MNKLLASLLMIGLVAAMAGAGTWAYFSDTETAAGNTFTAGTLDLKINGQDGLNVAHYTESNWKPGETRDSSIPVTNAGSLNGNLKVTVPTPTGIADTCAPLEFCNSAANLNGADFDVVINDGANDVYTGTMAGLSAGIPLGTLNAGTTKTFTMKATLNSAVSNDAQGDGISFDIVVTLDQIV